MLGAGLGRPRSAKVKTKAKYGYVPDYTSIVTGRRGKATKGQYGGKYSGFEVRPVTKEWSNKVLGGLGLTTKRSKKKR